MAGNGDIPEVYRLSASAGAISSIRVWQLRFPRSADSWRTRRDGGGRNSDGYAGADDNTPAHVDSFHATSHT